jgi:hypothetical protein
MPDSQQGIAKSGAVVLNPTFVHFMNICARLTRSAGFTILRKYRTAGIRNKKYNYG